MPARRCSSCSINWPVAYQAACEVCGGPTFYLTEQDAITAKEASSLRSHTAFDRWLEAESPGQRRAREQRYARELRQRETSLANLDQQLERG